MSATTFVFLYLQNQLWPRPRSDDDDYDIDFYTVGPVPPDIIESHAPQPSPREQLEVSMLLHFPVNLINRPS